MASPNPFTIAANWASLLYQVRHRPEAEADLAEAARVLHESLGGADLGVVAAASRLELNGARLSESAPGVRDVLEQCLVHGVGRLTIPGTAVSSDLLAVARALAAYPGAYQDWAAFLEALGPARERIQAGHAGEDFSFVRYEEREAAVSLEGGGARSAGDENLVTLDDDGLIPPPIEPFFNPAPMKAPPKVTAARQEEALRLERLIHAGRSADDAGDTIALLGVARDLLEMADTAPSEASSRVCRLELRRLLSRRHMAQFAKLAAVGQHRELAGDVLRRIGPEATEILMELLVDAESMTERRGYFSTLTRMADGTDVIMHHLDHPAWYVIRNAADLCGELRLERAVPQLAQAARHPDERVRKSVASALLRIATPEVLEPLARLLKDPAPAIRLQVLGNLDGRWGRPLAMSLAGLLETEDHPDVAREALKALGRIGTPDALQALQRAAAGHNRRLTRRQRVQAIDGLAVAGPPAASILRGLAQDQDSEIAESAARALAATNG